MRGEDFVHVKLSPAGEKLAAGGELRVVSASKDMTFNAGETRRVTRAFEWEKVLSHLQHEGESLFVLDDARAGLPSADDLDAAAAEQDAADKTSR